MRISAVFAEAPGSSVGEASANACSSRIRRGFHAFRLPGAVHDESQGPERFSLYNLAFLSGLALDHLTSMITISAMKEPKRNRETSLMLASDISLLIYCIRGQRVILDSDLADIYGVTHKTAQ
jgi:hypothetical protein